jgi:hypothetical protein
VVGRIGSEIKSEIKRVQGQTDDDTGDGSANGATKPKGPTKDDPGFSIADDDDGDADKR